MEALTDFYPAEIKPVRDGVYETFLILSNGCSTLAGYSHYSFEHGWSDTRYNIEDASIVPWLRGDQDKLWRGLANKP